VPRRSWWLYPAWIALCGVLFFALRGAEDPSRKHDRLLNTEAGEKAIAILHTRDPLRYSDYEVVHVAWAAKGEGGEANRWVVLCDHAKRSGLHNAVVVELEGRDGRLLVVRKPVLKGEGRRKKGEGAA
jgi:hypothetical protein